MAESWKRRALRQMAPLGEEPHGVYDSSTYECGVSGHMARLLRMRAQAAFLGRSPADIRERAPSGEYTLGTATGDVTSSASARSGPAQPTGRLPSPRPYSRYCNVALRRTTFRSRAENLALELSCAHTHISTSYPQCSAAATVALATSRVPSHYHHARRSSPPRPNSAYYAANPLLRLVLPPTGAC
jgi:hypothetical protein